MFGKMYTVLPLKIVFLSALVIFEVGSLIAGAAPTSTALIIGRAISGLGAAGIIAGIFAYVVLPSVQPYY